MTGCTVQPPGAWRLEFLDFCLVDLRLARGTALRHGNRIRAVLESRGGEPTTDGIRRFLADFSDSGSANNYVKSLRVYFRDFLGRGDIVGSFRFAAESPNPPRLFTKAEVDAPFHVAETEVMAKTMASAVMELAAKAAIYNTLVRM